MATVLDAVDRQIVHAMQVDGRAPFSRVATVLGVSEQTIARRWRRLRADGVVRVLGLTTPEAAEPSWYIRMRVQPAAAGAVADALARRPDVSWVSLTAGGAEITCSTRPRTTRQRDALLLDRLPRTVQVIDLAAFSVLHSYVGGPYEWTDFDDPLSQEQIGALGPDSARAAVTPVALDPGDELLLAALATDGRLSYAELAGVTGWSESRVARRVEALRSAGALYFDLEIARDRVHRGRHRAGEPAGGGDLPGHRPPVPVPHRPGRRAAGAHPGDLHGAAPGQAGRQSDGRPAAHRPRAAAGPRPLRKDPVLLTPRQLGATSGTGPRAIRSAVESIGTWNGMRATATASFPGWCRNTRSVWACAGRTPTSTATAAHPPARRVRGTASRPAVASSATPLPMTHGRGEPSSGGIIQS
jgi:DNA-binding Lrp family transcriptional regulator